MPPKTGGPSPNQIDIEFRLDESGGHLECSGPNQFHIGAVQVEASAVMVLLAEGRVTNLGQPGGGELTDKGRIEIYWIREMGLAPDDEKEP